jgi:hypothetical protein
MNSVCVCQIVCQLSLVLVLIYIFLMNWVAFRSRVSIIITVVAWTDNKRRGADSFRTCSMGAMEGKKQCLQYGTTAP